MKETLTLAAIVLLASCIDGITALIPTIIMAIIGTLSFLAICWFTYRIAVMK